MSSHGGFELELQYYSAHFSERLKTLRKKKGWSTRRLADAMGMSPSLVTKLERGRANPELATLLRLQRAFGLCSIEELLGDLPSAELIQRAESSQEGEESKGA